MSDKLKRGLIIAGALITSFAIAAVSLYFSLKEPDTIPASANPTAELTESDISSVIVSEASSRKEVSSDDISSADISSEASSAAVSSAAKQYSESSSSQPTPSEPETRIVDYTHAYTYARMQSDISALAEAYPELISLSSAGASAQGRSIPLIKFGSGGEEVLIAAGIHAREHITVTYALRCLEEYAKAAAEETNYGGYDIAALLKTHTVYIVPCINPDGMEIVGRRASADSSVSISSLWGYRGNANGVDLNRNFPFLWDEVNNTDISYYKGISAGSEAETQAMMSLCRAHNFKWMLSLHISGNMLYWADETNGDVHGAATLANALSKKCGMSKMPYSSNKNSYGGGFENWFRAEFGRPAICVELISSNTNTTPLDDRNHQNFDSVVIWKKTKYLFAVALNA